MNEHDFFKKMIFDHAVNDAYVKARTKYATPRGFAWRKAVSIAAAAFVVLVGTVFLIPSARAEVLKLRYPDEEVLDYGNAALMPGFIDLNANLESAVMRGSVLSNSSPTFR